ESAVGRTVGIAAAPHPWPADELRRDLGNRGVALGGGATQRRGDATRELRGIEVLQPALRGDLHVFDGLWERRNPAGILDVPEPGVVASQRELNGVPFYCSLCKGGGDLVVK